jgi:hypothetical protein
VITQTPLVAQAICSNCPNFALGQGNDGMPYCHLCRDWKAERHERISAAMVATKPTRSVLTFDPDSIRSMAETDLPGCMRALADAMDASNLDGSFRSLRANGFTHWADRRAHVLFTIDLASEVFKQGAR